MKIRAGTVAGIVERLAGDASLLPAVRLDIDGCRVDVLTDLPKLRDRFVRYFQDVVVDDEGVAGESEPVFRVLAVDGPVPEVELDLEVKPVEPGKTRPKEEWVDLPDGRFVRKLRTGMVFAFNDTVNLAFGPCMEHDNQIVNFVNNRYMQWRLQQGYVLAHAGAVARESRGLALCGSSGAGKSTTALRLVSAGLDFVSNDRAMLKPGPGGAVDLRGIPKHPRVNPGTILHNPDLHYLIEGEEQRRLEALTRDELVELEDKYDVLIDEAYGPGRLRLQAELTALVVIAWDGVGAARARRVTLADRPDLLEHVMKSPGLFYEPSRAVDLELDAARYVEVLDRRPVYEITGTRHFERAAELSLRILDR